MPRTAIRVLPTPRGDRIFARPAVRRIGRVYGNPPRNPKGVAEGAWGPATQRSMHCWRFYSYIEACPGGCGIRDGNYSLGHAPMAVRVPFEYAAYRPPLPLGGLRVLFSPRDHRRVQPPM